jgi:spore coat polysaccharide biosynthesis protein SpsF (cytidylyltransferase family)
MSAVGVFVTARTTSSRLPRKALLPIEGRLVIEHVLDRASAVRSAKPVVLCTSTDADDDRLAAVATSMGIAVHRGSLMEKFRRWSGAADAFGIDYFVEYDGDDFFCDPELMELAVDQMLAKPCDLLEVPHGSIVGAAAVCVSAAAARRAAATATADVDDTWLFMRNAGFDVRVLEIKDDVFFTPRLRFTLDYEEDLEFFQTVFRRLNMTRNTVPVREIVAFLQEHPEIADINWFRQADYVANRLAKLG